MYYNYTTQNQGTPYHRYWDFIENGDFDWEGASQREQVYFREVAAAFLRATFEPPSGYVIDVLEAEYNGSRFHVVALGWDQEPEPLPLTERQDFIQDLVRPLNQFVRAVDREAISSIRFGLKTASSGEEGRITLTWLKGSEPP